MTVTIVTSLTVLVNPNLALQLWRSGFYQDCLWKNRANPTAICHRQDQTPRPSDMARTRQRTSPC